MQFKTPGFTFLLDQGGNPNGAPPGSHQLAPRCFRGFFASSTGWNLGETSRWSSKSLHPLRWSSEKLRNISHYRRVEKGFFMCLYRRLTENIDFHTGETWWKLNFLSRQKDCIWPSFFFAGTIPSVVSLDGDMIANWSIHIYCVYIYILHHQCICIQLYPEISWV